MALVKRTWSEYLSHPCDNMIKDEFVEQDMMEIPSLQTDDIDYTIVDTSIHPLHPPKNALKIDRLPSKESPAKPARRKCKLKVVFYHVLIKSRPKM